MVKFKVDLVKSQIFTLVSFIGSFFAKIENPLPINNNTIATSVIDPSIDKKVINIPYYKDTAFILYKQVYITLFDFNINI